jgi:hypothetical protein
MLVRPSKGQVPRRRADELGLRGNGVHGCEILIAGPVIVAAQAD